ncbi:MAG: TIM44-like domain-containing protein [Hyphomicrobiales bacterium]|nr:TIM44-like domain-containing protein [Hyphomicrobiales bacterium]
MMHVRRFRPVLALFAMLAAVVLIASDADARVGRGLSLGSRGTRSFTTTPPTATAPTGGSSLNRTMAQPGPTTGVRSPGLFGGYFNRPGLFGGLLGGFLGAGLLGLLFGHGLFGGMGGIASIFGLLLQIVLVVFVARLIWGWWQRRQMPAYAGGPPLHAASSGYEGQGGYGGAGAGAAAGGSITLGPADYDTFERLLGEIETAYGREDIDALRQHATPEMVSYLADDLARNTSNGVVNRISDVKLLQGDLAEAWREGDTDYATVAMRYALKDSYVDRASGRVVDGDAEHPTEATELWTFRRDRGGAWILSAIQQPG